MPGVVRYDEGGTVLRRTRSGTIPCGALPNRLDCLELALGQRALRAEPRDFLELLDQFRR